MFPWIFFYAPQVHLPFSGSVAQRIEPDTRWFFEGIDPAAGDAELERKAFDVATYGRQLGLISEVLLDLAAQLPPDSPQGGESLARIADIHAQITRLKDDTVDARIGDIADLIRQFKAVQPGSMTQLKRALSEAMKGD